MTYRLIRSKRKTLALEIGDDGLIVRAPQRATRAQIEEFLQKHSGWIEKHLARLEARPAAQKLTEEELRALAEEARRVFPARCAHFAPIIGVTYGRITIRCQRTKWGSCSGKGNLNFNCLLMLAPPEVLDSVVVHELCHRKYLNHSRAFYDEVLRAFPAYREWHKWLRENGGELMRRIPG